jgi:hypothetical protein
MRILDTKGVGLQKRTASLPLDEIPRRRGVPGETGRGGVLPDHDYAIGVGIGERTEQYGVDGGEDGGVGADAEGERAPTATVVKPGAWRSSLRP